MAGADQTRFVAFDAEPRQPQPCGLVTCPPHVLSPATIRLSALKGRSATLATPMSHELRPRQGSVPSAVEVLRLLSVEFTYVKADADEGMRRALAVAEWLEARPSRVLYGQHARALEGADSRNLERGEALLIEFGDGPSEKLLKLMVLPGGIKPVNVFLNRSKMN